MRAVGVVEYGGPEALRIVEVPERHAGAGEVRMRVHAAAVSPTDTYVRDGTRAERQSANPPPYVPGMDAAGILDEIGEGVETDLALGDHVMAIVLPQGSHGGYSESLVLPFESVARAPSGASDAEASVLPMNGLTARLALDLLGLSPGNTLAVTGAAGVLGGFVIQLAKLQGLHVVADAAPSDDALIRGLGADVVVRRGDDVADRFRDAVPKGVDGLVDTALLHERIVPAVRDGGGIAAVRGFEGTADRGIAVHLVMVPTYAREQAKLEQLARLVEQGALTLRVADVIPAEQAAEAHRRLEAGGTRGRLVISFEEQR